MSIRGIFTNNNNDSNNNDENQSNLDNKNSDIAVKLPEWSLMPKNTNVIRKKRNG